MLIGVVWFRFFLTDFNLIESIRLVRKVSSRLIRLICTLELSQALTIFNIFSVYTVD